MFTFEDRSQEEREPLSLPLWRRCNFFLQSFKDIFLFSAGSFFDRVAEESWERLSKFEKTGKVELMEPGKRLMLRRELKENSLDPQETLT